ncbi:hypothetical protein RV07_GL000792 [Enterococcus malodoratus]|nr:hypothetical protein RV07_GL000792 [Enterococcus malodoratus]
MRRKYFDTRLINQRPNIFAVIPVLVADQAASDSRKIKAH